MHARFLMFPRSFAGSFGVLAVLVVGPASCGPAEAPPPVTAAAPPAVSSAPPAPPKIPEDRTPVDAAPAGVVATIHTAGPRALVRAAKAYVPSIPNIDPRTLVRAATDSSGVDRIVDVDKPMDMVILAPEPSGQGSVKSPKIGYAFGVEDDADVAAVLKPVGVKVETVAGGVQKLVIGGKASCVVAPAIGAAKRRLVCAEGGDPMFFAPWLARGVTRKEEPTSAIHAELDVAQLRKRLAKELDRGRIEAKAIVTPEAKIGRPEIDKVLKRTAAAMVEDAIDFVEDLDAVTFDVAVPPEGIRLNIGATVGSTKSWLARALLAGGDLGGAPIAAFSKLPGDGVASASHFRTSGQTASLVQPVQTMLKDLALGAASDFKWPAKDRDLALDVVRALFDSFSDGALAGGNDGAPPGWQAPSEHKSFAYGLALRSFFLGAGEHAPKSSVDFAKGAMQLLARPSFAQTFKALTHDHLAIKAKPVKTTLPKDAPKGSFLDRLEVDFLSVDKGEDSGKTKGKDKETSLGKATLDAVVVPEGETRTWFGFSNGYADGELWKKVRGAVTGAPSPLASRIGFDTAAKPGSTFGTVVFLDAIVRAFDRKGKSGAWLAKLPDNGRGGMSLRIAPSKPPKNAADIEVFFARDWAMLAYLFVTE